MDNRPFSGCTNGGTLNTFRNEKSSPTDNDADTILLIHICNHKADA